MKIFFFFFFAGLIKSFKSFSFKMRSVDSYLLHLGVGGGKLLPGHLQKTSPTGYTVYNQSYFTMFVFEGKLLEMCRKHELLLLNPKSSNL